MTDDIAPFIPIGNEETVFDVFMNVIEQKNFDKFVNLLNIVCLHCMQSRELKFKIFRRLAKDDMLDFFLVFRCSDISVFHPTIYLYYAIEDKALKIINFLMSIIDMRYNNNEIIDQWCHYISYSLYKNDFNDIDYIPIVNYMINKLNIITFSNLSDFVRYRANNVFIHIFNNYFHLIQHINMFDIAIKCIDTDNIDILKYLHTNGHYRITQEYVTFILNKCCHRSMPARVFKYAKNIVKFNKCIELIYCIQKCNIDLTAENIEDMINYF